jgi:hypothetical protein
VRNSALYFDVMGRQPNRTECLVLKMLALLFLKRKTTLSKAAIT